MNRKSAPRQQVLRIERTGAWGQVEYLHYLDCGHVVSRKRAASTPVMACDGCVLAEKHQQNIAEQKESGADDDIWDSLSSEIAITEKEAAIIKAALVARFEVPVEAVDVVLGDDDGVLRLQYAVILLSAEEVRHHLSQRTI